MKLSIIVIITLLLATVVITVGTMTDSNAQELESTSHQQKNGVQRTIPNDVFFDQQYALHNTDQTGGIADCDIDGPEAWDMETGSSDVVIAFIDTGIDYAHPDLAGKIWINVDEIPGNGIDDDENNYIDDIQGWNFYDDNNEVLDLNGHGTLCAGIAAAATDNGEGIAGICWNCRIMPLKVNGLWNTEDIPGLWIEAIEYAVDNGADIISMSLGIEYYHEDLETAVNYAHDNGIFLIASAGNQGWSNEHYPAAYDNVVGVAATNDEDRRMENAGLWSSSSNYGPWVDVAAPGEDIFSTMPTYYVTLNDYGFSNNYSGELCGTSCSAPLVAGVAGLLLSRNPSLSPDQMKTIIGETVDPYDSTYDLGTGRINAHSALVSTITVSAALTCIPAAGTVPFTTTMTVTLTNEYTGFTRSIAAWINVVIANGTGYTNWKSGWTNVSAGGAYITSWNQNMPALFPLVGDNVFTIEAVDVTPSPYNQPPYPYSGGTDTDACTLVALAP